MTPINDLVTSYFIVYFYIYNSEDLSSFIIKYSDQTLEAQTYDILAHLKYQPEGKNTHHM